MRVGDVRLSPAAYAPDAPSAAARLLVAWGPERDLRDALFRGDPLDRPEDEIAGLCDIAQALGVSVDVLAEVVRGALARLGCHAQPVVAGWSEGRAVLGPVARIMDLIGEPDERRHQCRHLRQAIADTLPRRRLADWIREWDGQGHLSGVVAWLDSHAQAATHHVTPAEHLAAMPRDWLLTLAQATHATAQGVMEEAVRPAWHRALAYMLPPRVCEAMEWDGHPRLCPRTWDSVAAYWRGFMGRCSRPAQEAEAQHDDLRAAVVERIVRMFEEERSPAPPREATNGQDT